MKKENTEHNTTLYLWSLSFKGEKYKNQSQKPQVSAVTIVFRTKIGFIHDQSRCFPVIEANRNK